MKKRTHDEFLNELKEKNPNEYKELEFLDEYTNASTPLLAKNRYGIVKVYVNNLLFSSARTSIKNALNKNEYYINQCKEKHGDRYDYSLVEYTHSKCRIKLICDKHGEFTINAGNHLYAIANCPKCCSENVSIALSSNHEDFISKFKEKNLTVYNSIEILEEYKGNSLKILAKDKYGLIYISPDKMLQGRTPTILSAVNKHDYFLERLKEVNIIAYNELEFITQYEFKDKKLICKDKYGELSISPDQLLSGCLWTSESAINRQEYEDSMMDDGIYYLGNNTGFTSHRTIEKNKHILENIECYLYFIKLKNKDEYFYKIGITKYSLTKRFMGLKYLVDEIKIIKTNRYKAIFAECELHVKLRLDGLHYKPKMKFNGCTECYTELNWGIINPILFRNNLQ